MTEADIPWIIKPVLILGQRASLCCLFNVSSLYSFGKLFAFGMTSAGNSSSDQVFLLVCKWNINYENYCVPLMSFTKQTKVPQCSRC